MRRGKESYPAGLTMTTTELTTLKKLKQEIIKAGAAACEGHLPSALSILDILWVLYDRVLNVTPLTVADHDRDRFFLSKGHASIGLYAVLAKKGFIPFEKLPTFCGFTSSLGGHPDRNKVPGVEASTGSLGHGFPMAVGAALGLKVAKSPAKVFALIGDGEANEGTVWESALLAAHHKLDNLTLVVDYNHSTDRALLVGDLAAKFKAFDWDMSAIDGHDHEAIFSALSNRPKGKPLAVIATTVKGHGIKSMEHNPEWHHKAPKPEELAQLLEEAI